MSRVGQAGFKKNKKSSFRTVILLAGLCLISFLLFFLGFSYFSKAGIFKRPGEIIFDESLSESEIGELKDIFGENTNLTSDVVISAYDTLEFPKLSAGEFINNIRVAVADFDSPESNIDTEDAQHLLAGDTEIIDFDELDFRKKLLAINGNYYLDNFESGAIFRVITFRSTKLDEEILPLVNERLARDWPSHDNVLTLAQTGVTALSRGMNAKLKTVGDPTYFSEKIAGFLSGFDLTHTSNESSFSRNASSSNICSNPEFINTLLAVGLDIVELTGNHNQDCGDEAALETLSIYEQNGISTYGGGRSAEAAAAPLEIDQDSNRVTMLAYNLSTGGATYDDTPGANQYTEEAAAAQIAEAKQAGNIVIVDVQYYECNAYATASENTTCDRADSAYGDQIGLFRHLIDLGADVVVGTSAHQPQTYELYGDGEIYYGLGNLFFDQVWWPGTTRSLVLAHYIYQNRILQTRIFPTVYDNAMQTGLMNEDEATWFLQRLVNARP